jgi:hypothetical protein
MGLTRNEIERVWRRTQRLLSMIDDGKIVAY